MALPILGILIMASPIPASQRPLRPLLARLARLTATDAGREAPAHASGCAKRRFAFSPKEDTRKPPRVKSASPPA